MKHIFINTKSALIIAVFSSLSLLSWAQAAQVAQAAAPAKPSVYTSPTFYGLLMVALLLLVFIRQLGTVLKTVAKNYSKGDRSLWDKMRTIVVLIGLTFVSQGAFAQAVAATPTPEATPVLDFLHEGFGYNAINALSIIILFELFVIFYMVRMIRLFIVKEKELAPLTEKAVKTSVFWDKFNASVSVESESAVLTDHEYDGIRELDNALPPWWKYGFYFTIVWAVFYLAYYHISNGPSSSDEYKAQLQEGVRQIEEYRAKAKNLVDETNVKVLTEAADIAAGKSAFVQYCAVCHSQDGGGIVGPNLTDKYWIHGGDIKDIFKTLKYGVQGKGMKSWQQELSPLMMAQVSSYVKSLQGTTPTAPKAPEGNEWIEAAAAPVAIADSSAVVPKDTTATAAK
jgi:cytochrome c oxidase cbb3-type subunit III